MLDPNLNPYSLAVAGACGVVAAAMHATSLAGSGKPWPPPRTLTANLITTAFVGVAVAWLIDHAPWHVDVVGVLLAAGLTGHVLGPRAAAWLFGGLIKAAQSVPVAGKFVPDVPPPESPPTPLPEPAPTPEEPHEPA